MVFKIILDLVFLKNFVKFYFCTTVRRLFHWNGLWGLGRGLIGPDGPYGFNG